MMDPEPLLDRLYEAAALPERWPGVLDEIARQFGAEGAAVFAAGIDAASYYVVSPGIAQTFQDYIDEGWMDENERGAPIVAAAKPWFVTDTDVRPQHVLQDMPVYCEFLTPRGTGLHPPVSRSLDRPWDQRAPSDVQVAPLDLGEQRVRFQVTGDSPSLLVCLDQIGVRSSSDRSGNVVL